MNGFSNLFDESEVWTDDELKMFVNLQTPIHKKKDDLLFPLEDPEPTTNLSDLSISPLVTIRRASLKDFPPSMNTNVSSSKPKLIPEDVRKPNSKKNTINSTETIGTHHENIPSHSIPKSVPTIPSKQNDENAKPQTTIKKISQNVIKSISQPKTLETTNKSSPKKPKVTKKSSNNAMTNQAPKTILKKEPSPSPYPTTAMSEQSLPSPILPPTRVSQSLSLSPQHISQHPQTTGKNNSELQQHSTTSDQTTPINPPPLPDLPPQQLVLKLFEEKQKRFFNRFEEDSTLLIDYISNFSIVK